MATTTSGPIKGLFPLTVILPKTILTKFSNRQQCTRQFSFTSHYTCCLLKSTAVSKVKVSINVWHLFYLVLIIDSFHWGSEANFCSLIVICHCVSYSLSAWTEEMTSASYVLVWIHPSAVCLINKPIHEWRKSLFQDNHISYTIIMLIWEPTWDFLSLFSLLMPAVSVFWLVRNNDTLVATFYW